LINFALKFVMSPPLALKFQSPERTNFFAAAAMFEILLVDAVVFDFCSVTKTNELIAPLAEKVSPAVVVVVFVVLEVAAVDVLLVCASTEPRLLPLMTTPNSSPKASASVVTLCILLFISCSSSSIQNEF
jgi:hypothetical protein